MRWVWATASSGWLAGTLLSVLALAVLSSATGCSGKTAADAKEELEKLKKKEKPKPNFERLRVITEPNEKFVVVPPKPKKKEKEDELGPLTAKEEEKEDEETLSQLVSRAIKPGHWTGVLLQTKANNFDFSGELTSTPHDNRQSPIDLERNAFQLVTSRQAALPKAQGKTLETLFFAPQPSAPTTRATTWMSNRLFNRQRGGEEYQEAELLQHMPAYQYYLYVLSKDPNRYRYLKVLDCVHPPVELVTFNVEDGFYYRVLTARVTEPLALPTQPLCWTSIAYVVWDDVLPTTLSAEQQVAMLDWLHWGGGLIISGPQTLDLLRGSFLDPYLPATSVETAALDEKALAPLNDNWMIDGPSAIVQPLKPKEPWAGIKLAKHSDAQFAPGTGELVVERRVGRGRIVATAFPLNQRELINWRCFDSFFNACLLRRPPRQFDQRHQQFEFVSQDSQPAPKRFDPELITNVRYFTRDAQDQSVKKSNTLGSAYEGELAAANPSGTFTMPRNPATDELEQLKSESGPAGWTDFSAVSSAARQALRGAAGISVPNREFVLWMVGAYLLAIVPVNWLVFRALGRVEWAWIAVPVLAVSWGIAVIYLAQLDIGFARSETEVAVLELQNGYSRAHLTRYTALHSSLSTSYDVQFDNPSAVALPFSPNVDLLQNQARSTVTLRKVGENQLDDYSVRSNSTGMIHSEQMLEMGGTLDWQVSDDTSGTVENNTKLKLSGVALVRRRASVEGKPIAGEPVDEAAWVGDLKPGARADVHFRTLEDSDLDNQLERSPLTAEKPAENTLSLRQLVLLAQDHRTLGRDDVRLVGWREEGLPGVRVVPAASQERRATLVVANLSFGNGPTPRHDSNVRIENKSQDDVSPPPPPVRRK